MVIGLVFWGMDVVSQVSRLISRTTGLGLRAWISLTSRNAIPPSITFVSYSVLPSAERLMPCDGMLIVAIVNGLRGSVTSTARMPCPPPIQYVLPSGEKPLSWPTGPAAYSDSSVGWRQSVLTSYIDMTPGAVPAVP